MCPGHIDLQAPRFYQYECCFILQFVRYCYLFSYDMHWIALKRVFHATLGFTFALLAVRHCSIIQTFP